MAETTQFPLDGSADRAYMLTRCQGFLVQAADGNRIGTVIELHYRSRLDQPDELAVRTGLFGHRLLICPTATVEQIIPGEHRLLLAAGATPISSRRLLSRLTGQRPRG